VNGKFMQTNARSIFFNARIPGTPLSYYFPMFS
jgi:hypothetical protein